MTLGGWHLLWVVTSGLIGQRLSGVRHLDREATAECPEHRVHLVRPGMMVDVQDSIDLGHVPSKAASGFGLANTLCPHALVQQHLDRRERRQGHVVLPSRWWSEYPLASLCDLVDALCCCEDVFDAVLGASAHIWIASSNIATYGGSSMRAEEMSTVQPSICSSSTKRPDAIEQACVWSPLGR